MVRVPVLVLVLTVCGLLTACGARTGLSVDERVDAGARADGGVRPDAGAPLDAPRGGPCLWSAREPEVAHRRAPPFSELHVGALTRGSSNALLVWYEGTAIFGGDPRVRYGARAIGFDGTAIGTPIGTEQVLSDEPIEPGGFGSPRTRAAARADGFAFAPWLASRHPTLAPGVLLELDTLGAILRTNRLQLPGDSQWNETHRVGETYRLYAEQFPSVEAFDIAPDGRVLRNGGAMGRTSLGREMRSDGIAIELGRVDPLGDAGFVVQAFDFSGVPQWERPLRIEESFSSIGLLTFALAGELTVVAHSRRSDRLLVIDGLDRTGAAAWRRELELPEGANLGGTLAFAEGELLILVDVAEVDSRELHVASLALDGSVLSELTRVWSGPGSGLLSSAVGVPGGAIAGGLEFGGDELSAIVQGLQCSGR